MSNIIQSPIFINASGNVGIGNSTPGISTSGARVYLTIKGATDSGALELGTGAADADAVTLGILQWSDINSVNASKRYAYIVSNLSGATANNRGSIIAFGTKADGDAVVERIRILSTGSVGIGSTNARGKLSIAKTVTAGYGIADAYLKLGGTEITAGTSTQIIGFGHDDGSLVNNGAYLGYLNESSAGNGGFGSLVFGKVASPEHKKNMSEGSTIKRPVICLNNNIMYSSIKEAAIALGIPHESSHIACVCKGKRTHTKGFKFQYYKEVK